MGSHFMRRKLTACVSALGLVAMLFIVPAGTAAAGQPAVDLDQCRNGSAGAPANCVDSGGSSGWVNGNVGGSQGHLLEGYSTPFRAVMTNMPTGTSVTLDIGYDIKNSGKNAYDYLTQYDRLEPHSYFGHAAESVNPTSGVSGVSATTSTFPIPAPSSAGSPKAGQPTTSFNALPAAQRVMTLFGGTITGMAYVSQGSLTASQSETSISVTFTVDNPTAVLAWGGHIAKCSDWGVDAAGKCNSAGGISGSPYHMRLNSWGPNLPNLGNTDRSMSSAVIPGPGTLALAKSLTGGPAGYVGPFTIHYDCGAGYIGDVSVNAGSTVNVPGIPDESQCVVSEPKLPAPPADYTFGTPTFTPSNTVTIQANQTATVTTNNTLSFVPKPAMTLTKTDNLNPAHYNTVGQVVTFTLTAKNTGNVTLHNVTITDVPALDNFDCPPATVAVGASLVCTGTHTITQADIDKGSFSDVASATSDEVGPVEANDEIVGDQTAKLALTKTDDLNPALYDHVGQVVTYTLTAKNTGNITLHNVTVSDAPALDDFSCTPAIPVASLAPGASVVCTGTHTITQADIDAGKFVDTASASATEVKAPDASDTINAEQTVTLGLTKSDDLNPAKYDHVGQLVTYTLTAKNTGNVTLHNVTVSDAPALDSFSCTPSIPVASLAPGASVVCTGTHSITQADIDAGKFVDTASASATEVNAPDASDTIYAKQTVGLGITKTDDLNPAKYDEVGTVVTYTLTAKNTGNVTLHNVTVSDAPALDSFSCTPSVPVASLAPGASIVCTGTHTITQADLDAGFFKDTASAKADEAAATADDTIWGVGDAILGLTKVDDLHGAKYDHVGQVVGYTIKATNLGNITLHNVTVSDNPALDNWSCTPSVPVASLAPGASITCTGTHSITQADLDAGKFLDTASAKSDEKKAPDADDTVFGVQSPAISVVKTDDLNPSKFDHVGQVVNFTITATNTGNVTLHNVTVSDDPALDNWSCMPAVPATLAPGASIVCKGSHTITQADLDLGYFKDVASAKSDEASGSDDDTVNGTKAATIGVTKTDNLNPDPYKTVGQVVKYTIVATNTGNVTLHNVTVTDDPVLDNFVCDPAIPVAALAPGEKITCTGTHTVTQADLNQKKLVDTATAKSDEASAQATDTIFREIVEEATGTPAHTAPPTSTTTGDTRDNRAPIVGLLILMILGTVIMLVVSDQRRSSIRR